jgi:anti-anti-sigma factor
MEVHESAVGDVRVLAPRGSLYSTTVRAFDRALNDTIDRGARLILIDGNGLEMMTSVGLRVLLTAAKRLQPMGGRLALCGLSAHLVNVFALSGFDKMFAIYRACDEGLAAIRGERG